MYCPICHMALATVEIPLIPDDRDNELELDFCVAGHGIWFDRDELEVLLKSVAREDKENALDTLLTPGPADRVDKKRRCPRCESKLLQWQLSETMLIERCAHNCGLWFDKGELKDLCEQLESQGVVLDPVQRGSLCSL